MLIANTLETLPRVHESASTEAPFTSNECECAVHLAKICAVVPVICRCYFDNYQLRVVGRVESHGILDMRW